MGVTHFTTSKNSPGIGRFQDQICSSSARLSQDSCRPLPGFTARVNRHGANTHRKTSLTACNGPLTKFRRLCKADFGVGQACYERWDDWGGWFDHVEPPNVEKWDSKKARGPADAFARIQGQQFRYRLWRALPRDQSIHKTSNVAPLRWPVGLSQPVQTLLGIESINPRLDTVDDVSVYFLIQGRQLYRRQNLARCNLQSKKG